MNTKSLEDAVTLYLNLAEEKTKEAREKSAETALKMVEDLDMIESPEGYVLCARRGSLQEYAENYVFWLNRFYINRHAARIVKKNPRKNVYSAENFDNLGKNIINQGKNTKM